MVAPGGPDRARWFWDSALRLRVVTALRVEDRRTPPSPALRAPRDWVVALLLFVGTFGFYCSTTGNLTGYEPQTAAVAEGLVKVGAPRIVPGSPVAGGLVDPSRPFGHAGLAQPLFEAPVYWLGEKFDEAVSGGRSYAWRDALLRFYNPLMAAVTVLAIFLLLRLRGRSQRRALGVAALAAVGTMIWPYSKIGMETTMMAMVSLMILGAAWATMRGGIHRFALTGLAAGAAAASKPVGVIMLAGLLGFTQPMLAFPRRERIRYLVALALPIAAWLVAIAWYNNYRYGSVTNFGQQFWPDWPNAPIAFLGMLVSPGKGLLWFSPLVILGALGMRPLWREDRPLALAIAITFGINLVIISGTIQWTDDTWGPRYIAATEWLLVLPIAWWVHGQRRRRTLAAVAAVAITVQVAGVFAWYGVSVRIQRALSGQPSYLYGGHPQNAVAYGDDGPTWIMATSELRFQLELVAAWVKDNITGTGFKISYEPFWGRPETVDFTHTIRTVGPLPDFWWNYPGQTAPFVGLAVTVGLITYGSAMMLVALTVPRRQRPRPAMSESDPH